jgi:hypothetical protein
MGAALLLTYAVIDEARSPDWSAAERRIASVSDHELDDWLEQADEMEYACERDSDRLAMARARNSLQEDVKAFRDGVEGNRRDMEWLAVRGARAWVTGGMSWGDESSDLSAPHKRLHAAGVLAAAGFDG